MRLVLRCLPAAVLTFLLGVAATAFLMRPIDLPNGPVEVPTIVRRTVIHDPSTTETANIYALVLSNKGFVGFLHEVRGYKWVFEVFEDPYRSGRTTLSKDEVRDLRSFGLDDEAIESIKRPSGSAGSLRRYLTSIPGLIIKSDGSQFIFDEISAAWVPVQFEVGARGGISISEVIYIQDKSLAVVNVGLVCGSHCGESGFYVLRKSHGSWHIVGSLGFTK